MTEITEGLVNSGGEAAVALRLYQRCGENGDENCDCDRGEEKPYSKGRRTAS